MSENKISRKTYFNENLAVICGLGFLLFVISFVFGVLTRGSSFSPRNFYHLFTQFSLTFLMAPILMLILRSGEIDLSPGALAGFVGVLTAYMQTQYHPGIFAGLPPQTAEILWVTICVAAGLLTGIAVGTIHGLAVVLVRLPAAGVTFITMLFLSKGILLITKGQALVPMTETFRALAYGVNGKITSIILFVLFSAVLITVSVLRIKKKSKRENITGFVAVGFVIFFALLTTILFNLYKGVPRSFGLVTFFSLVIWVLIELGIIKGLGVTLFEGIDPRILLSQSGKKSFFLYPLMGAVAALSGIFFTSYMSAGIPGGLGAYATIDTFIICLLAMIFVTSKKGSFLGVIVSGLLMAVLVNGLSLLGINVFYQVLIKGIILILIGGVNILFLVSFKKYRNWKLVLPVSVGIIYSLFFYVRSIVRMLPYI